MLEESELAYRRDLRDVCIFTIDPATARDLDDALSCEPLENGNFRVGVHIADVGHYVKAGSELDKVAKSRATSVYVVQKVRRSCSFFSHFQVIPMLPPILSELLCSLNPNIARYAFSCIWELTPTGQIVDTWLVTFPCCSSGVDLVGTLRDQELREIFIRSCSGIPRASCTLLMIGNY